MYFSLIFSLLFFTFVAPYKVQVPSEPLMGVRGTYAVLTCSFPPVAQPGIPPGLLVTWQRVEDSRVVHSFYYDKDQLSRQSNDYKHRTALYVSELWTGNASLKITDVRAQDAGRYLCTVSDDRGTDKAEVRLEYAAFYTEPQLSIEVGLHNTSVQFETQGFPKAEIQWLGPQDQELQHVANFTENGDGLFHLSTSYVLREHGANASLTLRLSNPPLHQVLMRHVSISKGQVPTSTRGDSVALTCTCVILSIVCAGLLLFHMWRARRKKSNHPSEQNDDTEMNRLNGSNGNACHITRD
ncbi:CD276 antigen-like isoform X2 [Engraulis encrasicolus]|uniref:CD276 antigen-like isoform X2 n=1 Tax=Engraulis encrasicolus TaxID=184585 RepID=UPI002FD59560